LTNFWPSWSFLTNLTNFWITWSSLLFLTNLPKFD
jgi:hypothetical protein